MGTNEQSQEITGKEPASLERYRLTIFGSARNDFDMATTAINDQVRRLSVVSKALDGFIKETEIDGVDVGFLMGAREIMDDAMQTIDKALNVLEDLDVSGDRNE